MESISDLTSKLSLENQLYSYYQEFSDVLNKNRGRDTRRISKITSKIYVTGLPDIIKTPYDAEFHQRVIIDMKNENITNIIKIGKPMSTQQVKRFAAKNIDVAAIEIYRDVDIEKIYDDMLNLYNTINSPKNTVLFVCDDGKTYAIYLIIFYFIYITYMTKINNMDQPALLEITDINKFSTPRILEFIMITKKDVLENRPYLSMIFNFEMNLKFHATQKIYDLMLAENFDSENIDYTEIASYKSLMNNVKKYLKRSKKIEPLDLSDIEEEENLEIDKKPEIPKKNKKPEKNKKNKNPEKSEDEEIIERLEKDEPYELSEEIENSEISEKIEKIEKNGKNKKPEKPEKHEKNIDLNVRYPKTKDTDISIISYLF